MQNTQKLSKPINAKYTTDEFIQKAAQIHGDKYDYSKVNYVNAHTKVCIICPEHGEFWQRAGNHLRGDGCPNCGLEAVRKSQTLTNDEFITKAKQIHGDRYDYSKVVYKHNAKKVCIIYPIHGEFWQTPNNHLHGDGCPHCKISKLEEEIANKLNEANIHFTREQKFDWLGFGTVK